MQEIVHSKEHLSRLLTSDLAKLRKELRGFTGRGELSVSFGELTDDHRHQTCEKQGLLTGELRAHR